MAVRAAEVTDPYASRLAREQIVPRRDPVLWGDHPGPLDDEALATFARRGHWSFSLVGPDEVAGLRQEAEALAASASAEDDAVIIEPEGDAIRSIFRVHQSSAVFARLAADERLVSIARQVLGGDVYVHQSRLNYKPAFEGKGFYWHSDFETWHMEDGMPGMRAVSLSLALTPNLPANGPLMVIPGSHMQYVRCRGATPKDHFRESLKDQRYGVPSHAAIARLAEEGGGIDLCTGPAGSATLFDANAMHGSSASLAPWPRTNLFLVYNSVDNALVEPFGGQPARPAFLAERDPAALRPA